MHASPQVTELGSRDNSVGGDDGDSDSTVRGKLWVAHMQPLPIATVDIATVSARAVACSAQVYKFDIQNTNAALKHTVKFDRRQQQQRKTLI